ncbi:diguanylate cyclase domain-containing protein [Okeania sp. SIO1I7]|uniref:diguanylate cyclase domain-containing protein n=1 Tax=Okeania sp. SIO1I7 TaxID=2607772 RepID=UPI0013FB8497|nr:diguanylate cyclase [Okeania sp. SIO1I7]NET25506.1 diguanylate cyclase [Okeania sp. SIO1I7]
MDQKKSQNLPANILVVDDAPENLRLLASMLEHHGYYVRKAINGRIAINGAQISKPDLILLDINLPDIDGYEVCQQLKTFEKTKEIPVIFISSYNQEVDKIRAFEVGGRDYITKPFQIREVLARVENQLSTYRLQMELKERNSKLEQEIIERQRTEEQIRFLLLTNQAISATSDIHSALEVTLNYICSNIRWDFGEAWLLSSDGSKIVHSQAFYTNEENLYEFRDYSKNLTFTFHKSLPGRVWQSQYSEWIEDIFQTSPDFFQRYDIAVKVGLKSCFAVPILWSNQVLGILVFFKKEVISKNQQLIDLVKAVANHLGVMIQSRKAEYTLKLANQRLHLLATLDGLTQVANRRHFDEYLDQEWQRMKRDGLPFSLIICDVDYFKLYNDNYGHQAGDDCLKKIAKTIQKMVDRPGDLVARYGGEEFAIILPNTDAECAFRIAETIRLEVQNLKIIHAKSEINEYVTISLGISSMIPQENQSPAELISLADQALYQAKNQQRNCTVSR